MALRISRNPNSEVKVDDGFLIALAKRGDRNAYDRLVKRYHGFVRLKASSYFLAGGDSDDLIQEGLVGLYKAIRDFRTDRESSFRNFAELCITRQIITAVKTATRNKHTPLNQYVSFSSTPAAAGDDVPTLDQMLPGPTVHDPVNQVISSEELRSLVGCLFDCALRAREPRPGAVSRRLLLRAGRRAAGVRHQDGRQRPAARQAQGRCAPAGAGGGGVAQQGYPNLYCGLLRSPGHISAPRVNRTEVERLEPKRTPARPGAAAVHARTCAGTEHRRQW